jgi:hypothetical protein
MLKDTIEKNCKKLQDSLFEYSNAKIGPSGEDLRYGIVMQFETVITQAITEALAECVPERSGEDLGWNRWNDCIDQLEQNIKQYLEGGDVLAGLSDEDKEIIKERLR